MADINVTSTAHPPTVQTSLAWPLSDLLVLGALPTAVPCARLHTRNLIYEWQIPIMAETVELVVSELVTNSVRASTQADGRPRYEFGSGLSDVHLTLSSDRVRVLIEVWDASPWLPTPKMAGLDDESGRGLVLVQALCERSGWYACQDGRGGKVVWGQVHGR